jgi:hypothetical protein
MTASRYKILNPAVGPTRELSLRVSAATLVRVLFENPADGTWMLALERKATLHPFQTGEVVEIKSQPFGGAIRILNVNPLQELSGGFNFDSESSRSEQDFRIFIQPSTWQAVRQFCIEHISQISDSILESSPERELAEEFDDALKISLKPSQYYLKPTATVVEEKPNPTQNHHAHGYPTVRVYRIFEARITDSALARAMLQNSESLSNQAMRTLALQDAQLGGKGRANAILALGLTPVSDLYAATPPEARNGPVLFGENRLDETVAAVLDKITVPKYQWLA